MRSIAGVGMISVGVLGGPFLGSVQDDALDRRLRTEAPAIHGVVAGEPTDAYLMTFQRIDYTKVAALPQD